ncbi:MAG: hypothetical protein ACLFRG_21365, partial [Desulfococcaceae bacterium]
LRYAGSIHSRYKALCEIPPPASRRRRADRALISPPSGVFDRSGMAFADGDRWKCRGTKRNSNSSQATIWTAMGWQTPKFTGVSYRSLSRFLKNFENQGYKRTFAAHGAIGVCQHEKPSESTAFHVEQFSDSPCA